MRIEAFCLLLALSTACAKRQTAVLPESVPAERSLPVTAAGESTESSSRAPPALWEAARRGEVMDLNRLAEREGAVGLLQVAASEGSRSRTALSALPYAEDAPLALRWLCDRVHAGARDATTFGTLQAIASKPPRDAEPLDPGAAEHCLDKLGSTDRASLPPKNRDLLASAEQMLREQLPPEERLVGDGAR